MAFNGFSLEKTPLNMVTNVIRTAVMALVGIWLIPFYVDSLGVAAYGIIPVATTVTSYVMILTDSLGTANSRYITLAIRKTDDASKSISTALFGILRICLILLPVIILISVAVPYAIDISGSTVRDVQALFVMVLAASLISAIPSVFFGVYSAFNTLYVWYGARLIYTVSQVALILFMFGFFEPSLAHVGASYIGSSLLLLLLVYVTAKRQYPKMKLSPELYDRKLFRTMGNLGAWAIINRVGNLLYIEASLILTNVYLGSEADAGVAIIASLVSMIHTACYSITASLEPLVYACYSDGDIDGLKRLTSVSMKFVSLMMAMPLALIIVFAPQVLHAWVGDEFGYLSAAVAISLAGDIAVCAYTVLQDVPVIYLKVKELTLPTFAFGFLNIAVTAALLSFTGMGIDGVITIWLVCTLGFTFSAIPLAARMMGAPLRLYLAPIAEGYCVMALCMGGLWALSQAVSIPGTWTAIIPLFAAVFLAYAFAVLRFSKEEDKKILLSIMPDGLRKIAAKVMG
ncbi:MAG: hypothetical protein IKP20_04620 [Candidatus Methanomethylophilaceae archaeon]|nr:hypothetical protein [Candidatus Methanomethylophilaceae archaeon]